MKMLDGFAGAGGWTLAAESLGIADHGIENMKAARATRDAAGLQTIHDDVWTGLRWMLTDARTWQGLIASPPCPTFSAAGKKGADIADVLDLIERGVWRDIDALKAHADRPGNDPRTELVLTPLTYVDALRPDSNNTPLKPREASLIRAAVAS